MEEITIGSFAYLLLATLMAIPLIGEIERVRKFFKITWNSIRDINNLAAFRHLRFDNFVCNIVNMLNLLSFKRLPFCFNAFIDEIFNKFFSF